MLKLLVCGSSHRKRSAGGWTDETWLDGVLRVLRPDIVGHGASPSGGGDAVAEACAVRHYRERGLDPEQHIRRFPMEPAIDGEGGVAFMRRNARQGRELQPTVGIALCVGRVGQTVGTRGNYLSNGTQQMTSWLLAHGVPVVVRREDGIEPCGNVNAALDMLRRLYAVTRDEGLVAPGKALRALVEISEAPASREEVLTALRCAAEGSRFGPWIRAVEATVKALQPR